MSQVTTAWLVKYPSGGWKETFNPTSVRIGYFQYTDWDDNFMRSAIYKNLTKEQQELALKSHSIIAFDGPTCVILSRPP